MKKTRPLFLAFILFALCRCGTTPRMAGNDYSVIYKKDEMPLHPKYEIFHHRDSSSTLYFRINSSELLYSRTGAASDFTCLVRIGYKLTNTYDQKEVLDSSSVFVQDKSTGGPVNKDIIGQLEFKAKAYDTYYLEVRMRDMNRGKEVQQFFTIDKSNDYNTQNFVVLAKNDSVPLFRQYLKPGEHVRIRYKKGKRDLIFRYYRRDFPLAPPPFSISNPLPFNYNADSIFVVKAEDTATIALPRQGFYHVQVDSANKEGLTLFRFYDDFPYFKTPDQLIFPLRYITARSEYENLMGYRNKKTAVDSFWMSSGGSAEKGKDLVRKFYNRVLDANNYYTSYLEGWKTDRGMIYLVYGAPNVLYRTTNSEMWVYGEENNINSLTFTFEKVINPFSDNDFRLERNAIYKTSWMQTVEIWRQGRVYQDK